MKKKFIFFIVLLCVFCLLSAAAAAERTGSKKQVSRLPAKLSVIGEDAFAGTAFESIVIPESVLSIGSGAFANMPNLKDLCFSGTVKLLSGSGFIRMSGQAEKPESPEQAAGNMERERLPGLRAGSRTDCREGSPSGTADDPEGSEFQPAAHVYGPAVNPQDGEAFHPLRLRFP